MAPEITKIDAYKYFVVPDSAYGTPFARYSSMAPHVAAGTCKPTGVAMQACAAHRIYGVSTNKFCDDYYATEYVCSQNLRDIALLPSPITGEGWHEKTVQTSVTVKRVDGCAEMAADAMCTAAAPARSAPKDLRPGSSTACRSRRPVGRGSATSPAMS